MKVLPVCGDNKQDRHCSQPFDIAPVPDSKAAWC
jgi:hypothetical protein